MLSHSPALHCGLNPVTHLSPSHPVPHLEAATLPFESCPLPPICRPCAVHISPLSTALSPVCLSWEQRGAMWGVGCPCCPWYTMSVPCAGHTAVLHRETPHGNCHHHPAGVRQVPRRRLQVRMLGRAGEGEWERMDPCSITSVSCQSPQEAAPWTVRAQSAGKRRLTAPKQ